MGILINTKIHFECNVSTVRKSAKDLVQVLGLNE